MRERRERKAGTSFVVGSAMRLAESRFDAQKRYAKIV
jgi:hypothetical protein